MPAPLTASLPPFLTLDNGYIVRVTAQDPTDGTVVTAVVASNVSIAVDQTGAATGGPDLKLSPSFLPGQV